MLFPAAKHVHVHINRSGLRYQRSALLRQVQRPRTTGLVLFSNVHLTLQELRSPEELLIRDIINA